MAEGYFGRQKARKIIQNAWHENSFTEDFEKIFIQAFSEEIEEKDHTTRANNLLWDNQVKETKRLLPFLSEDYQKLFSARIALQEFSKDVDAKVEDVPKSLFDDPGFVFDRARWRRVKGYYDTASDMLAHPAADKVDPEKWWHERHVLAQEFLEKGFADKAYDVASQNSLPSKGEAFASAEFLSGWIALVYMNDGKKAFKHFQKIYENVTSPVSLARGAYWCGRAQETLNNQKTAKDFYEDAAKYYTTYYGQLAFEKLQRFKIDLPQHEPYLWQDHLSSLQDHEFMKAIEILDQADDQKEYLNAFAIKLFYLKEKPEHMRAVIAFLDEHLKKKDISVRLSKKARQYGHVFLDPAYPYLDLPSKKVEQALVLSIIRQESEFNEKAVSHAGARGLMQLMPGTAKRVSRTKKVKYSKNKLTTEKYNLSLGTAYLEKLLDEFDENYPLAIAAYNAGPHNVRKWIKRFGDPREKNVDTINWIEQIPYGETRNYVQRVLENLYIYRQMLEK